MAAAATKRRPQSMVEELERAVVERNLRGVRTLCERIRGELREEAARTLVEAGAVSSLLSALNYGYRDALVVEHVFSAIAGLGRKFHLPALSSDSSSSTTPPSIPPPPYSATINNHQPSNVSATSTAIAGSSIYDPSCAMLVRLEGVMLLVRTITSANSDPGVKSSMKIRALFVQIMKNFSSDELGSRLVVGGGAIGLLVDTLRTYHTDRTFVTAVLSTLANLCLFQESARNAPDLVEIVLASLGRFPSDEEVTESAFCILTMISSTKLGAMSILSFPPAPPHPLGGSSSSASDDGTRISAALANDFSEAANLALQTLQRLSQSMMRASSSAPTTTSTPSKSSALPFASPERPVSTGKIAVVDALRNAGSSILTNLSAASPIAQQVSQIAHVAQSSPGNASKPPVSGAERRCACWAAMMLHNLVVFADDAVFREDLWSSLDAACRSLADNRPFMEEIVRRTTESVAKRGGASPSKRGEHDAGTGNDSIMPSSSSILDALKKDRSSWEEFAGEVLTLLACDEDDRTWHEMVRDLGELDYLPAPSSESGNEHVDSTPREEEGETSALSRRLFRTLRGDPCGEEPGSLARPLPCTPFESRLYALLHLLYQHPLLRRSRGFRSVRGELDAFARRTCEELRRAEPGEFFSAVARSLEGCFRLDTEAAFLLLPYRRFTPMLYVANAAALPPTPLSTPLHGKPLLLDRTSTPASPARPSLASSISTSASSSPPSTPRAPPPGRVDDGQLVTPNVAEGEVGEITAGTLLAEPRGRDAGGSFKSLHRGEREDVEKENDVLETDDDDRGLAHWRGQESALVLQLTLKMEKLYLAVDPTLLFERVTNRASSSRESSPARVTHDRFVDFYHDLVQFFVWEVLSARDSAFDRGELLDCIIEIASLAANVSISNVALTMACLEALEHPAVARLQHSWNNVIGYKKYEHLKRISSAATATTTSTTFDNPPPFLRSPSLPHLVGFISEATAVAVTSSDNSDSGILNATSESHSPPLSRARFYASLSQWLPTCGLRGDWYPRHHHALEPDPAAQVFISKRIQGFVASLSSRSPPLDLEAASEECESRVSLEMFEDETAALAEAEVERIIFPPPGEVATPESKALVGFLQRLAAPAAASLPSALPTAAAAGVAAPLASGSPGGRTGQFVEALASELVRKREFARAIHASFLARRGKTLDASAWTCAERCVISTSSAGLRHHYLRAKYDTVAAVRHNTRALRAMRGEARAADLVGFPRELWCDENIVTPVLEPSGKEKKEQEGTHDEGKAKPSSSSWPDPFSEAIRSARANLGSPFWLPSAFLEGILEVKDRINEGARVLFARVGGRRREIGADDFLPLLTYVVVSADLPELYARLAFVKDFYEGMSEEGNRLETGEAAYYVVSLETCLLQLRGLNLAGMARDDA